MGNPKFKIILAFVVLALAVVGFVRIWKSAPPESSLAEENLERNGTASTGAKPTAPTGAQGSIQNRQPAQTVDPLLGFLKSKDKAGEWVIQRGPDGRASHILGGRIPAGPGAQGLTKVLLDVAPYLGVQANDLKVVKEEDDTGLSNSSQMSQYYGKYRVYGSTLKAFSNPNTDEVYHIVSELRPLQEVDTRIGIDRNQATEVVRKSMGTAQINSIKVSKEPLVFGTSPSDNILVWRILVISEKPAYQSLQFLISARDGAIVDRRSQLRH